MNKASAVGRYGEELACKYLENKGYRVLQQNYRKPWGEIDIIAKEKKTGLLVFVEVKTLVKGSGDFTPEGNYSFDKAQKTKRAAQLFAGKYPNWFDEEVGWRVDLITVLLRKAPISSFADCIVKHYENVDR